MINFKMIKKELDIGAIPPNTRLYLDFDSKFFERYGRQLDVKTTLCIYWD